MSQSSIISKDCINCQSLPQKISNSRYETDFGVSSAEGAGNTKIIFPIKSVLCTAFIWV